MIKRTDEIVTGRSHVMLIGIARERGIGIVTERGARIESADRELFFFNAKNKRI